ncbi:hypothetical protein CsSME_00041424 [Camellia sinensis var. sinensis]
MDHEFVPLPFDCKLRLGFLIPLLPSVQILPVFNLKTMRLGEHEKRNGCLPTHNPSWRCLPNHQGISGIHQPDKLSTMLKRKIVSEKGPTWLKSTG